MIFDPAHYYTIPDYREAEGIMQAALAAAMANKTDALWDAYGAARRYADAIAHQMIASTFGV